MDRKEVLESIQENVENANLRKHMMATESVMRALARLLDEDEDEWGLTGLIHDIDVELTEDDINIHSKLGSDLARELGASDQTIHAVLCHNATHGIPCETKLDKALFCADPLTGLITAATLVREDKKIAGLETKSVLKRFKEKSFAAGVNRDQIMVCRDLGIELEDFVSLGLKAMKNISDDIGL